MLASFGTDPEFVIYDEKGNLRSAIPIIVGGKKNKVAVGNNGALAFYDNVNLELNIPPGRSAEDIVGNLSDTFHRLAKKLSPRRFVPQASATYPDRELTHEDAKQFGCDPEYCAYELNTIKAPTAENGFRSCGGHIHLGGVPDTYPLMTPANGDDMSEREMGRVRVIRMMDLFVGLPGVLIDHDKTTAERRKLYGKAGSHRPCDYGVEYRSMGNFWLNSPQLVTLVYNLSAFAVAFTADRDLYAQLWADDNDPKYPVDKVRQAIDTTDRRLAAELMEGVVKKHLTPELYESTFSHSEPVQYDFYRDWGLQH